MKNDVFLNNLTVEELKDDGKKNESSFVFNNLSSELSVTLGNYYRRIILSYMTGFSIFALKISNREGHLESEFSVLEGLIETPPYLILNLRKVLISAREDFREEEENEDLRLEIEVDNNVDSEYVIKSGDIKDLSGKLEILNPESYIATLSPFSFLKIDLHCRSNWGYRRSDENILRRELPSKENGLILIDSNYNPIINVSYKTDFIVTGLEEQNEKLILKIETNGSLSPREALKRALELSLSVNERILDNLNER